MAITRFFLALLLPTVFLASPSTAPGQSARSESSLAFARAQHLRRGINASEWFAQVYDKRGYTPEHFQAWTTAEDIALIKSLGFDHIRLSVNPQPMFNAQERNKIPAQYLSYLDAAVKMILDHDLAVVVDLHPDSDFKARLAKEDDFVERFADFWRALAQHYSSWNADHLFLEILNEPEFSDRYRWLGVQMKLAAAIREGAPSLTIIAAGARWSNDDELVFQEPLRDPNVIYNFHFYEPHIFTHQGATWSANYWHELKGVPYPSTPENVRAAAAEVPDAVHRLAVIRYGLDRWNAQRIDTEVGQVKEWAEHYGVPVICDEFGVYRNNVEPKARIAWLTDVRTALEKRGIGWAMWEYHGGFGVVTTENGQTVPDEATLRALGLTARHRPDSYADSDQQRNRTR